ncbi:hypothetical protein H6P81_006096 [Aristolochia fimbriata]|uniref:Aminotransferase-like plant mobile domain-containing protein n=1 Tax=Aristolochia fimbriata TaxID=158543 RepID=A0AAV7EZW9_ARIFI|nr:hypothetical protein H6P81_006096 [Aristolochia fimbriata]
MDGHLLSYIDAAGFGALFRVQWLRLDKPLITSLVERWRSETNTFYLANGEMTITLEDMAVLLGLRVDGFVVIGSTRGDWMELARTTRRYSWRGVMLAFLYRELAKACRSEVVGIGGCFTLLQLWAWECLHIGRPTLLEERALQDGPLGFRWNVQRTNATNPCGFLQHLPAICVEGRHIWWSRTPLICFEIVKMHVPDRVMLQFGLEQVTPPEDVEHVTRISQKGRVGEDWAAYYRDYIARWQAREDTVVTGSHAHTPRHALSEYMAWYLSVTRRFISPPPTKPAMVYHARGYTEEVLEPTVPDLLPVQTPEPEPELPPEPEPDRHPPIHRFYIRKQKKAIGAPEPSFAL